MKYTDEQRKQLIEQVEGRRVGVLEWDAVDGYWVMTFEDGPEICFRLMAELV